VQRAAVRALAGLALATVVCLSPARAQEKTERVAVTPVIGVVDVQLILREAAAAKTVRDAAEAHGRKLEEKLNKQREELKVREQQLRQQQAILSPAAFNQKREELERHVAEVRRQTEQARAQLNQVFNVAMNDLREAMRKTVVAIMEEKGIAMTLPRTTVLVYDERMNITDEVLAQVNKRLPAIKVDFDKPLKPEKPAKR
jgi:Skp family chaperone for outer membrane proteins